jgi:hypothetical protein
MRVPGVGEDFFVTNLPFMHTTSQAREIRHRCSRGHKHWYLFENYGQPSDSSSWEGGWIEVASRSLPIQETTTWKGHKGEARKVRSTCLDRARIAMGTLSRANPLNTRTKT